MKQGGAELNEAEGKLTKKRLKIGAVTCSWRKGLAVGSGSSLVPPRPARIARDFLLLPRPLLVARILRSRDATSPCLCHHPL